MVILSLSTLTATTIAIAIVGRAITLERNPSKKKQGTDTKKDAKRIKSDIFTKSNREKSNIAIAILEYFPLRKVEVRVKPLRLSTVAQARIRRGRGRPRKITSNNNIDNSDHRKYITILWIKKTLELEIKQLKFLSLLTRLYKTNLRIYAFDADLVLANAINYY